MSRKGKNTNDNTKKSRRGCLTACLVTVMILLAVFAAWKIVRASASVSCTAWERPSADAYSENDRALAALSLSWLVYGCETVDAPHGTVADILDTETMWIIIENAYVKRTDPRDPATAIIDSADFIRQTTGDYRFLTELKDKRSSFYGAAYADDEHKTVWLAFSGSVSLIDAVESAMLVLGADLSLQEKCAFELYESVLASDEIKNKNYDLILTGHSLGGALASMVSRMSGCTAVTISGADGVALDKLNDIVGGEPDEYRIVNYMTSPKNGKVILMDIIQRMMFFGSYDAVEHHVYADNGMTANSHSLFAFIEFEDGDLSKPRLPREEVNP